MNPSTEDFAAAISQLNAKQIFVLPNNSNIILAAQQAASITEGKNVHVFDTKSIPEGLCACLMFNPEISVEENIKDMNLAISNVKTGQVTYAIKDTSFEGIKIEAGDYMGIKGKEIIASTKDMLDATKQLIDSMINDDSEIITIIYGEGVQEEQVEQVSQYVEENYEVEIDIQNGKQPVYSFIIGVE